MPFFGSNKLVELTVPASFGGDVSDVGCLVVFWGMACVVETNDILYITTILICPFPPNRPASLHCSWLPLFMKVLLPGPPTLVCSGEHELSYQDLISIFHMGRKKK